MTTYQAAYQHPNFMQSLPKNGAWVLVDGNYKSGQLLYRDSVTGAEALVPSIWYNQPVAWRIDMAIYRAERAEASAARLRLSPDRWAQHQAGDMARSAIAQWAMVEHMKATGEVMP